MSEMSQAQVPASTGASGPTDDGELGAEVGPDHNEQSEGDRAEPGDRDTASDPMPDVAGTGS